MGAEFDCDAVEGIESVGEQEQFGLRVECSALDTRGIPGGADLNPAVCGVDAHVGSHTDGLAGRGLNDGKGQHGAGMVQSQATCDLCIHFLRRGRSGVPKVVKVAVLHGTDKRIVVLPRKRD